MQKQKSGINARDLQNVLVSRTVRKEVTSYIKVGISWNVSITESSFFLKALLCSCARSQLQLNSAKKGFLELLERAQWMLCADCFVILSSKKCSSTEQHVKSSLLGSVYVPQLKNSNLRSAMYGEVIMLEDRSLKLMQRRRIENVSRSRREQVSSCYGAKWKEYLGTGCDRNTLFCLILESPTLCYSSFKRGFRSPSLINREVCLKCLFTVCEPLPREMA